MYDDGTSSRMIVVSVNESGAVGKGMLFMVISFVHQSLLPIRTGIPPVLHHRLPRRKHYPSLQGGNWHAGTEENPTSSSLSRELT